MARTTILDGYCPTNRNFNALGNKERTPGLDPRARRERLAIPSSEFWDSVKRTPSRWSPTPAALQTSLRGPTLEQTRAPAQRQEDFKPKQARLSYEPQRGPICRALGIGRASSPLGKSSPRWAPAWTRSPTSGFLYQYILPQPDGWITGWSSCTLCWPMEEIVNFGREAAEKQTQTLVNRGAALLARSAADGGEQTVWQEHLDAGRRQLEQLNARYADAKNAEAEARRAYLSAHGAASASRGQALDAPDRGLSRHKMALDRKGKKAPLPAPRACWQCCAAAALRPASGPKRSPPRSCRR